MKKYPLLSSQLGIFLECMEIPESTQYNLPIMITLDPGVDPDRLDQAWDLLVQKKILFHNRYELSEDGTPLQWPDESMVIPFVRRSCTQKEFDDYIKEGFVRPFHLLSGEPLVRVELVKTEKGTFMLLDIHHTIIDGFSYISLLGRELNRCYCEKPVSEDRGLYEAAEEETQLTESEDYRKARDYFTEKFAGVDFVTLSKGDGSKTGRLLRASAHVPCNVCDRWCVENGIPANLLFESAFVYVMSMLCRQKQIAYGISFHGRNSRVKMRSTGMFVNTLPIMADVSADCTVRQLAESLQKETETAISNAVYPVSHLKKDVGSIPRIVYNYRADKSIKYQCALGDTISGGSELERPSMEDDICVVIRVDEQTGENYEILLEGSEAMNSREIMDMLAEAIRATAVNMMADPDGKLRGIAITSTETADAMLKLSTGRIMEYDANETWLSLFSESAKKYPDAIAVTDRNGSYTYRELDSLSDSAAARFAEQGVEEKQFAAIKMGRSREFLAAVIGLHKIGAAYVPIDSDYPEERIRFMLDDSEVKTVITEEMIRDLPETGMPAPMTHATPDHPAYMIYTSGSTGTPKGVVIAHRAMNNFIRFIRREWQLSEHSRIACHSNFAFDAAVEDLYPVLTVGGTLFIVPDEARKDIMLMRAFLKDNRITGGNYTTQLGQLLGADETIDVDYMVLGGERMTSVPHVRGRVINTYGPTEFTVDATWYEIDKEKTYTDIPIGRPLDNCMAMVMDMNGHLLPQGATGELCLCGPQIAEGYRNRPEKTAEAFGNADLPDGTNRRVYHTGDLVRYDSDGQLLYEGRIDSQIKLRGFRIELGEIENKGAAFPGIHQISAQVRTIGRAQQICLYYTADREIDPNAFGEYLSTVLPDYMVPAAYTQLATMPYTANGKIDLRALPEPKLFSGKIVAPETELEKELVEVIADQLSLEDFGVTNNLISLGMSSLAAMRITVAIQNRLQATVRVADLMKHPTVRELAQLIEANGAGDNSALLRHQPEQDTYPITENQRGVLVDWEMNRDAIQYNIPGVYVFADKDANKLAAALKRAVELHASMKTRLVRVGDDVMQQPMPDAPVEIPVIELKEQPDAAFFQKQIKPFDLFNDTLYRIRLYTFENKVYLMMDIHHIIFDGLSGDVFMNDVMAFYNGKEVIREELTSFDYALYEEKVLQGPALGELETYFDNLTNDAAIAALPASKKADGNANGRIDLHLDSEGAQKIRSFCEQNGVTPGSYFQAAFAQMLYSVTREERFLYLTISNGRSAGAMLHNSVGMFVKTLPVVYSKDTLKSAGSVHDYVLSMHDQLQETFARELYSYTKLVQRKNLHAEIMFAYQGEITESGNDFGAEEIPLKLDTAKMPVTVNVFADHESYLLSFEYDGTRYSCTDIDALAKLFAHIAPKMADAENIRDVSLVSPEEEAALIALGSGEIVERDHTATVLSIFRDRVNKTPNAVGLIFRDRQFTYRALDELSDRLAVELKKRYGIGREDNIGVMISRSELMLIYPLAVMKTGAAYMPLDPHFPTDRLDFMCKDANVKLILTEGAFLQEKLPDHQGPSFNSCELSILPEITPESLAILTAPEAHDRLVVLYTSGSTGKPKAVELEHFGVVNFCDWYVREFELSEADRTAGYANFGFDAHMIDLYPSIMAGSAIVLFDDDMRMDIAAMNRYMEETHVTVAFLTTQIGCIIREINHSLRVLSTGGEKMPPVTPPAYRFLNVYGPTECSLFSTFYDVKGAFAGEYIGRPLSNYQTYIVDPEERMLPRGFSGELVIAGEGVARGYLNRPELTKEKFIRFKLSVNAEEVRAYRSGDLVRWSEDGNIEFLGRIDKQVKLRGLRIELGEIENRASSFPGIRQVVADVKGTQNQRLCCYYVSDDPIDTDALKAYLAETLTEYMVPEVYISLKALPLNPNGKVDHKALPEPDCMPDDTEIIPPETPLEKQLFEFTTKLLGNDHFGVTSSLVSLGLSSLMAMRLSVMIYNELNRQIRVPEILSNATIRKMAEFLSKQEDTGSIPHAGPMDHYPITENQRGLYIDWEMNQNTTQYNIPNVYVFDHADTEKMAEAIRNAIEVHSYLKTRFEMKDGDIVQIACPERKVTIPVVSLEREPDEAFFQTLVKPFDLAKDELYRFSLYRYAEKTYLFMDIHHIVFDGLSSEILLRDIMDLYQGKTIMEESITAYDLAVYAKSLDQEKNDPWFDELANGASAARYPESESPDGKSIGNVTASMPRKALEEFCGKTDITVGSYLQATVLEVFRRITREEKPLLLTVSNGRSASAQLQRSMGMFVQTMPVAAGIGGAGQSVADYVHAVHDQLRQTFSLEMYPYTRFWERHKIQTEVMFVYQGDIFDGMADIQQIPLSLDTLKFPMTVTAYLLGENCQLMIEYDGERYRESDMNELAGAIIACARSMTEQKWMRDVQIVTEEQRTQLIRQAKGKDLIYDTSKTWVDLFKECVEKTPDRLAVADGHSCMSYRELDVLSDAVAFSLSAKGVKENDFVAVEMERVKEFVAAVLGIHKVGAAYVPIDITYPEERIRYIEENSEAKVILTEKDITQAAADRKDETEPFAYVTKPEDLAYMIYTSGSTGKPKGAMVHHAGLMNLIYVVRDMEDLAEDDRIEGHRSFSFDAHIEDMYAPLTLGASFHIMPSEIRKDLDAMYAFLEEHRITGGGYSTAMTALMLQNYPQMKVRFITGGGEKMENVYSDHIEIINVYGPTECTDDTTYYKIKPGQRIGNIPIGTSVANSYNFILDKEGNLLPPGLPGELCFAGIQVGRGYWKLPEKTAAVFSDCPFVPGMRMYRTGDLARYNNDGQIEYLGRIDTQVKLRGFRIELGEVESCALRYEQVRSAAAEVRKNQLVLYFTAFAQVDPEQLKNFMASTLTEYMVPTVFMQLDAMPMTPNGKINRKALPDPQMGSSAEYVAPETTEEKALAEAMQQILSLNDPVGALDNFFELGGDSIKAIRMVSLLRQQGISLQVADVMKQKTVRAIASCITQGAKEFLISREPFTGTVADTAIFKYFRYLELPLPNYYNQSTLLKLSERADKAMLAKAIEALAEQHDAFRAVIENDHLVFLSADHIPTLEEYDLRLNGSETFTKLCEDIQAHLDLQKALTRIALIHENQADYLLIVMHHTVVDGVSWRIIVPDLETAYAQLKKGEPVALPEKTHTYNDYAQALLKYAESAGLRYELPYWEDVQKRLLSQATSVENDHARNMGRVFGTLESGDASAFMHADFTRLKVDINDVLLTAVCMSYRKAFNESKVSVQMEGHGREDIGEYLVTDRTVGWFTSIFPVVVEDMNGDIAHDLRTVKEALHRVPNKGVGYNVLRFLCDDGNNCFSGNRIARLGFNYLGDMNVENSESDACFRITSEQSAGDDVSPKNVFGPDLSINCYAVGDTLFGVMFDYNRALLNDEQANDFVQGILKNMKAIVKLSTKTAEAFLTPTDLGEDMWTQSEFDAVLADFKSRGERIARIYPLLPMQEGMLLHHISKPGSWGYRLVSIFELDIVPTEAQLRKALDRLGNRHEVLRTAVIYEGVRQPRQAIVDRKLFLDMYDYSNESDPLASVLKLRENILSYGFDLQKKSLFHVTCVKKNENAVYLLVGAHHIITDGWCTAIYMGDLMRLINEEVTGCTAQDETPARGVYEAAVREILRKDRKAGLVYWRGLLDGYDTRTEIASNGPVPEAERSAESDLYAYLEEETTRKIIELCNQQSATLSNGMELLWGLILHTYNRTDDAVFAKVVSGRDKTKVNVDGVVGLFINSVPVRVKISETMTGRELLGELQKQTAASNEWDFCPLEEIEQETDLGSSLLQNILAFENFDSGLEKNSTADELSFHIEPVLLKEENFDELTPSMYMTEDQKLCLHIAFDRTKYRKNEIEQLMKLFMVLARGLAESPDRPLCRLPRIDENDEADLMQLCKGSTLEFDTTKTWIDHFLEQVRRAPDALAVADRNSTYTYKELNEASDKLACRLSEQGIQENDFVALKITRSKEFTAAFLAVQKLGAAYVPIDLSYPEERIDYIVSNSEAKLLLDDEQVREIIATQKDYVPVNRAKPENYAYMIYTSGSTGKPKGVVLHHRGLLNNSMVLRELYALTPEDRISAHRSFSFDSHIEDFYPTLIAGASVHILPEDIRKDPGLICDFLKEHRVTGGGYSTAMAMILLTDYHLEQRFITCGGEALKGVVSDKVQIINEYGPTECTCDISAYKLETGRSYDMIPIGRPWPNGWCFILDRHGNLLPRGLAGELCYASPQVGYGYWKLPENTRKAFTDCPFVPGLRMYHTGDLARYNEDGDLLCLGRIDFQVKLRGYRIELGEIEATAIHHPDITQAVAQIRHDNIVLYYTARRPIDTEALGVFLSGSLAEYMVPTMYMELKEMPMTPNGKINLKALPDPNVFDQIRNEPPANPNEANVLAIARELIPDVEFGVTDDLRTVGLTSIKAMKLAARISSELMMNVRVSDIMRFGNIRACLKNKKRLIWLYEAYDSAKPTLVVVHGIVHVNDLKHLMESWKKYFNLLVVEPIQVHYHALFEDETFNGVTGFYTDELGIFLPEDADIFGFAGFSFGGELALGMAADYEDQTGKKTFVLMGDSFISGPADMKQEEIPFETVEHTKELMLRLRNVHIPDDIAKESVMANNIVLQVRAHKNMRVYDGPVRFMMAYAFCDPEDIPRKREMITEWAPNVQIDDFKDQPHEGLFTDPALHPYFEKLFEEQLKAGD